MSVTIYKKDDGSPIILAHIIDAKEAVALGKYVWNLPAAPKVEETKAPAKAKVEPAVKKEKEPEPIVEKEEPVIEKEEPKEDDIVVEKPVRKINPRIIRK